MASVFGNSAAEDAFTALLEVQFGLVEGEHFTREHTFAREFRDSQGETFRTRVDYWFPQWRIVVEFKAGPLGRNRHTKEEAAAAEERVRSRPSGVRLRDVLAASWSNQIAKFNAVAEQSNEEEETAGILWILADDTQMSQAGGTKRDYTRYRSHQVTELRRQLRRRGHGWNPMGTRECGRLLWMFREITEATGQEVWSRVAGTEYWDSLSLFQQVALNVQWRNTVAVLLPELHTLDTLDGLHLVFGTQEVPPEGACCRTWTTRDYTPGKACGVCGAAGGWHGTEVVEAMTVPLFVAPQHQYG